MGLWEKLRGETGGLKEIKITKTQNFLEVSKKRAEKLNELVDSLDFNRRKFLLSNLGSYFSFVNAQNKLLRHRLSLKKFFERSDEFERPDYLLEDLTNTVFSEKLRFYRTGYSNPLNQFIFLFHLSMTADERKLLYFLLKKSLKDIYVPERIEKLFNQIYKRNIRQDLMSESGVPKSPLILVIGDSRIGKTETINEALQESFFDEDIYLVEPDFSFKGRWRTFLHKSEFYELIKDPANNRAITVEMNRITPSSIRSKWYSQSAKNFKTAFYPSNGLTAISIIEEAQGVLSKPTTNENVQTEEETTKTAITEALDSVISGQYNIITIALTNSPDQIAKEIYYRFFQHGAILDLNSDWNSAADNPTVKQNLKELVKLELRNPSNPSNPAIQLDDRSLDEIVSKIPSMFDDRDLRVNPGYIRRIISSIVERKRDFKPEYLEDQPLVREGFKEVAKNTFGIEFYNKVVRKIQRLPWENYIGEVREQFMNRAIDRLYHNSSAKGIILPGPTGSGKTHLVQCFLSTQPEVEDLTINPSIIFEGKNDLAVALENIDKAFSMSKMLSPSVLFIDEIDALIPLRNKAGPEDKIVNEFLNKISGERSFKNVFVVGTTNRLDIIDPAVTRSLRLDILPIEGNLSDKIIENLINLELSGASTGEIRQDDLVQSVKKVCNTPSDVVSIIRTLKKTRETDERIANQLLSLLESAPGQVLENLVRDNRLTIEDMLEESGINHSNPDYVSVITRNRDLLRQNLYAHLSSGYQMTYVHLKKAVEKHLQNPYRRSAKALEDFLKDEVSKEPQVGFVIGMAAGNDRGWLVPISSTLLYKVYNDKFLITGFVSPGEQDPDTNAAVKMAHQSAQEAYTTCINYLSTIASKKGIDINKVIGEHLEGYTIHHQFLNPQYVGGGPSAGYAMVLNTLSLLLDLPVLNDFGITGAPWSKGPTKQEVGSPIIIGGERLKTYKALDVMKRMYLPEDNLKEIPKDYMRDMAEIGKLALPVYNLRKLIPQVFLFNEKQREKLNELMKLKAMELSGKTPDTNAISGLENELSKIAEEEIENRIEKLASKYKPIVNIVYSH